MQLFINQLKEKTGEELYCEALECKNNGDYNGCAMRLTMSANHKYSPAVDIFPTDISFQKQNHKETGEFYKLNGDETYDLQRVHFDGRVCIERKCTDEFIYSLLYWVLMNFTGIEFELDYDTLLEILEEAESIGNAKAKEIIQQLNFNGLGITQHDAVLGKYAQKAYEGDAQALFECGKQYYLGQYYLGKKVPRNIHFAMICLVCAVNKKNADSMYYLGLIYECTTYHKTYTTDEKLKRAYGWYETARELGNVDAVWMLGKICYKKNDYAQTFAYFSEASAKGHVRSTHYLGYMYENGCGILKDLERALECYAKAGESRYKLSVDAVMRLCKSNKNKINREKIIDALKQINRLDELKNLYGYDDYCIKSMKNVQKLLQQIIELNKANDNWGLMWKTQQDCIKTEIEGLKLELALAHYPCTEHKVRIERLQQENNTLKTQCNDYCDMVEKLKQENDTLKTQNECYDYEENDSEEYFECDETEIARVIENDQDKNTPVILHGLQLIFD